MFVSPPLKAWMDKRASYEDLNEAAAVVIAEIYTAEQDATMEADPDW
jgi:hypothetical protein